MSIISTAKSPRLICVAFTEIHLLYAALVDGGIRPIRLAEPGSYHDYCVREQASLSALTLESPEIRQWIEFAENNGEPFRAFRCLSAMNWRPLIR